MPTDLAARRRRDIATVKAAFERALAIERKAVGELPSDPENLDQLCRAIEGRLTKLISTRGLPRAAEGLTVRWAWGKAEGHDLEVSLDVSDTELGRPPGTPKPS